MKKKDRYYEEGARVAKDLMAFINNVSFSPDGFVEKVCGNHRTLQQSAFRLFMHCVKRWASTKEGWYDARNEATIKACKLIMKRVPEVEALPFI